MTKTSARRPPRISVCPRCLRAQRSLNCDDEWHNLAASVREWTPDLDIGDRVACRHWPLDYTGNVKAVYQGPRGHWMVQVTFPRHDVAFVADQFVRA